MKFKVTRKNTNEMRWVQDFPDRTNSTTLELISEEENITTRQNVKVQTVCN